ncbi:hypothetical protein [Streptomyces sp. NPDC020681]|uniref:hypothetical protein n=1 Tax=Streptomyces sp. NPDC020681 TaxID=3365083 RepID=UPI0037AD723C
MSGGEGESFDGRVQFEAALQLVEAGKALERERSEAHRLPEASVVRRPEHKETWDRFYQVRSQARRAEARDVIGLALLAVVGYAIAYFVARGLFERVPGQGFQPSDTAQMVTAVSALATAVGAGIASILKAYALLVQARADMIRAKASLPPAGESSIPAQPEEGENPSASSALS